jgi:GTPase involved in cell partitioning and DNA repair
MEIQSLTLTALAAIGIVNVISFFKPDLDSRVKFALSVLAAFAVTFIPPELGSVILEKAKEALVVAFAASGAYKIATKAGQG